MPFDFATTKRPEMTALMRNACAFTFQQGPDIFFDDLRLRATDISPFVKALKIPFHWMLGDIDVYTAARYRFYDADDIASFLALNPRLSLEQVAEASELMPYQQPALVAQRIAEAAHRVARRL